MDAASLAPDARLRDASFTGVSGLLDRLRLVESDPCLGQLLDALTSLSQPTILSFLNQHGVNIAFSSSDFRAAIERSDVLLRDGVGVELCLRAIGRPAGHNCNGTDLIPQILSRYSGRGVAVFGTRDPWLAQGCERIEALGPEIVAAHHGFSPDDVYIAEVERTKPALILLAMGMPRQEVLAAKLAASCEHPCLIVNGGAIVDFLAARFPRAPVVIRRMRLEWLFRLAREPRRLCRRYVAGGVAFALLVGGLMIRHRRSVV